ncbi:MAG: DUF4388 domain-containing protein [Thermomicrobiales bacterium]
MQGSLSEFSLSELLQLFALSEKTGTVTVSHENGDSRLFLEAGRIVGWGLDDFDAHASILACRYLPPATEAAVRSIAPEPGTPGLAFVVRNLVEPQRWTSFVQRLLEQDVYHILDLDNGEFDILVDRIPPVPLSLSLSVQQLILDGSRWEADSAELTQEGYGTGSTWRRAPQEELDGSAEISPRDWLVLSALAEQRTIGEVGALICLPDLETAEIIKSLHQRKLAKPVTGG